MNIYPWQESVWKQIASLGQGQPNTLLLMGRRGIGKLDFARAFSQYLLCENRLPSLSACGKCQGCLWYSNGNHPDFRLLQPGAYEEPADAHDSDDSARDTQKKESNQIRIEQVRGLDEFINLTSHRKGYKVIVIHPAESMNLHAANAVLKTLEEPPDNTLFILVSHKPRRLLPTIVSRCHSITMPVPGRDAALAWLAQQDIVEQDIALAQAGYAPLAAVEIAEREDQGQRREFLHQISMPRLDPLALAENARRYLLSDVVSWLQKWICDLAYCKITGNVRYHLDFAEALRNLSTVVDASRLMHYYRELLAAQRALLHPLNSQLVLAQLAVSYHRWVLNTKEVYDG